jgi:hypothetical protein
MNRQFLPIRSGIPQLSEKKGKGSYFPLTEAVAGFIVKG